MMKSPEKLPPKRRTLNHQRIMHATFAVLDERGLDKLSLRLLAEKLDVQAPALYKHYKNKDALLIALTQIIMDEWTSRCEQLDVDWQTWFAESAQALRQIVCAHRDGPRIFMQYHSYTQTTISALILNKMREAGFAPFEALSSVSMLINFVIGFTLEEDFERHSAPVAPILLAEHIDPIFLTEGQNYDRHFSYALERIIAGIDAQH